MQQSRATGEAQALFDGRSSSDLATLHTVLDAIEYGLLFLDGDLRVRMHNRAYREMWQLAKKFLAAKPLLSELMEHYYARGDVYTVDEKDWPGYVRDRIAGIRAGRIGPVELRPPNGRIIQYQCTPLPDGGRMLTYFDVTEQRTVEQTLRESEQRYALVAEAAEDGIYDWNIAADDVYISPRLDSYLRFDPGELARELRNCSGAYSPG